MIVDVKDSDERLTPPTGSGKGDSCTVESNVTVETSPQDDTLAHSQAKAMYAENRKPSSTYSRVPDGPEQSASQKKIGAPLNNEIMLPVAAFVLSFFFPPIGCAAFCHTLTFPETTPRYRWGLRAMYIAASFSFIYVLLIACLLGSSRYRGDGAPILRHGF